MDQETWKLLLVSFWHGRVPVRIDQLVNRREIQEERGNKRRIVGRVEIDGDTITVVWPDGKSPYPAPLTAKIEARVKLLHHAQHRERRCEG